MCELRQLALDSTFATIVLNEMGRDVDFDRAVRLFNEANTDRSTVSQAQELISVVSAIQRLLSVKGGTAKETRDAFLRVMAAVPPGTATSRKPGVLKKLAEGRQGLRAVWMEDLYALRGNVGHGHEMRRMPSLWTPQEHLLLTAFLFPLLVAKRFADEGLRPLSEHETDDLHAFEHLLSAEGSLTDADQVIDGRAAGHWWQRLLRAGQDESRCARVVRELERSERGGSARGM